MTTFVIGDVQGCLDPLQRLLDQCRFDPASDSLWFCGDLVNRGGDSLGVLRLVRKFGDRAVTVLGNHDLHLLAQWCRPPESRKTNAEFAVVFAAADGEELLDWLRHRPLLHLDKQQGAALVHAGIDPRWDAATAQGRAEEAEAALRGERFPEFMANLYGKKPDRYDDSLTGHDRLRAIINVLTRMRFCDEGGRMAMSAKGPPGTQPAGFHPWFATPGRVAWAQRIFFGHWSALGLHREDRVVGLDSGYIWGGALTAVDAADPRRVYQIQADHV